MNKTAKAGRAKLTPLPKTKGQQASEKVEAKREQTKAEIAEARKTDRQRKAEERKRVREEERQERREAQTKREREWLERRQAKAEAKEQARQERKREAEERKAQKEEEHACFCGCGTLVRGKTLFAMGHDGKMHGWFIRATRDKNPETMPVEASDEAVAGLEVWSKSRTLTMREVANLVREQAKAVGQA